MQLNLRTIVVILALMSGAALAGAAVAPSQPAIQPTPVPPVVLSGADVGFRMTARKGTTPVGQLVVKVDGEWREAAFSYGMKPLTSQ